MKKIKMLVPILMLAMMFNAGIFMFSTDGNIAEAYGAQLFWVGDLDPPVLFMNTTIDPTAPITCTMGWDIRTFDELYYNVY